MQILLIHNLRITSIEVTYSIPAVCTASNLAFLEPVVNKLLADAAFTQTASSLNATTAIVYESSNTGVANVNATTGESVLVRVQPPLLLRQQAAIIR